MDAFRLLDQDGVPSTLTLSELQPPPSAMCHTAALPTEAANPCEILGTLLNDVVADELQIGTEGEDPDAIRIGLDDLPSESPDRFSYPFICNLAASHADINGVGRSLCAKLEAAARVKSQGNSDARDAILSALQRELVGQERKILTPGEAGTLDVMARIRKPTRTEP